MFRAALVALAMLASVASVAAAEGPPQDHKWWQGQRARELGLTKDQSDKIESIWSTSYPRFQAAMDDFQGAQRELDRLLAGDRTTEGDVVRELVKVQGLRNEASRQLTLMLYRFYRELSPEQRQRVKAMFDRQREEQRRGRRGDPPQRPVVKK